MTPIPEIARHVAGYLPLVPAMSVPLPLEKLVPLGAALDFPERRPREVQVPCRAMNRFDSLGFRGIAPTFGARR